MALRVVIRLSAILCALSIKRQITSPRNAANGLAPYGLIMRSFYTI